MTLLTLKIRVYGRSFWVDRGTYLDVLFPDDKLEVTDADHHFVTVDGSALGTNLLAGGCLDLYSDTASHVRPFAHTTSLNQPGWLDITISPGSVAATLDAVVTGKDLVAALRLPHGEVAQLTELGGPFEFVGSKFAHLGWGVDYFCTMDAPLDAISGRFNAFTASRFKSPIETTTTTLKTPDLETRQIAMTITSLSSDDRQNPYQPLEYGDELTETQPLFEIAGSTKSPLPVFRGSSARRFAGFTAIPTGIRTSGEKPCPSAWGVWPLATVAAPGGK